MNRPVVCFSPPGAAAWLLGHGSTRSGRWLAAVVLGMALAGLSAAAWQAQRLRTEERLLLQGLAQARARTAVAPPAVPAPAFPAEALRKLDPVVARLNMPWSDLFDALERRTPASVALLSLEPDAVTSSVALTAQAQDLDGLLGYAQSLAADPALQAVRIVRHESRAAEPGQPLRLSLNVSVGHGGR